MKVRTLGGVLLMAVGGWCAVACSDDGGSSPDGDGGESGAAQAGSAGTAGGSGEGGEGGNGWPGGGGAGGAGGAGGVGGADGGIGGDGGAGGERPALVALDCNDEPFTLDEEHVRYCTVLASCTRVSLARCLVSPRSASQYWFFSSNAGGTVTGAAPLLDGQTPLCPTTIATCDDVFACTGERSAEEDCDTDGEARCDGELAINCGPSPRALDCELLTGKKGSCAVSDGVAGCQVKSDCDVAGATGCDGDVAYECGDGAVGFGRDCAAQGLTCAREYDRAFCVEPPVGTCETPSKAYCEEDQRTFCNADGQLFQAAACAGAGSLACAIAYGNEGPDDYAVECAPEGCGNAWNGGSEECDGDDYVASEGYWNTLRIHCPSFGFATCRDARCVD